MNATQRALGIAIFAFAWSSMRIDLRAEDGVSFKYYSPREAVLRVASESPLIVAGEFRSRRDGGLRSEITIRITEVQRNVLSDVELQRGQDLTFRLSEHRNFGKTFSPPLGWNALWLLHLEGDGHFHIVTGREEVECHVAPTVWGAWLSADKGRAVTLKDATKWQWICRRPREVKLDDKEWRQRIENSFPLLDRLMEGGKFHPELLEIVLAEPIEIRLELARMNQTMARMDDDAWTGLQLLLLKQDKEPNIRTLVGSKLAYNFLGERPDAKAALVEAFDDPSPNVRVSACQSLMFLKDGSALPAVVGLLDDMDSEVRLTAVRTLGWLGSARHVPAILRLYESGGQEPDGEWIFVDSLSRLGEQSVSLKAAKKCISNDNWNVRYFVVEALQFNKSPAVVSLLMNELPLEIHRTCRDIRTHHVGDRVLRTMCAELENRTQQSYGRDVVAWMRWWKSHCDEYDGSAPVIDYTALQRELNDYESLTGKLRN